MIRAALTSDKVSILNVAVDSGLFPAEHVGELSEMMDNQLEAESVGHHWIVDEDEGQVLAAAYYAPEPLTDGTWNLYFIAVREALKGKGRGTALLQHVEDALCTAAQRILLIETSGIEGLELTRKFYLKHGYTEEARIREFYGPNDDKIVFWRKLNEAAL